ncbi:MAG: non-homologous end-joining DNA ligase [Acidimicrobiales bacterium]
MLAGRSGLPAEGSGWLVEPKWDGVRATVTIVDRSVSIVSRNGRDVTEAYPELSAPPAALRDRAAVLDGEVIALDGQGRPNFGWLQRRMHVRRPPPALVAEVPVSLMLFDVVWLDGELLTARAQRERRAALDALGVAEPPWMTSPILDLPPGDALLETCRSIGLEGVVLKRWDAPYLAGRRSDAWVKVKCTRRRDFVVGGWSSGQGGRTGRLGSLALGVYDAGKLVFMGMAGSGLSASDIAAFQGLAGGLDRDESPFADPTPPGVRFLEPVLVAEVTFSEVTAGGTLRHPVLEGFRTDIDASDVVVDDDLLPREG